MMNTTLQSLITYLNDNPTLLYEALNTPQRWEILDLFILDIDRPGHWKKIQEYNYNMSSLWNIIMNSKFWFCIGTEFLIMGLLSKEKVKTVNTKYRHKRDQQDELSGINTLFNYVSRTMLATIVMNINQNIHNETGRILFIRQTSEYMLKEIKEGNVSPEFIDLLVTIFQITP